MIKIPGLQPHDIASHVEDARRDAVRSEAVDEPAVAPFPQQPPEPDGRLDKERVIDLVEIPFVEQEFVKRLVFTGQFCRQFGSADVEIGDWLA
jgi:hypothetical protein